MLLSKRHPFGLPGQGESVKPPSVKVLGGNLRICLGGCATHSRQNVVGDDGFEPPTLSV